MLDRPPRSRHELRELLTDAGVSLRKSLGQHYLVDANLRGALLKDAGVQPTDIVLEVGVGLGILTDVLLQAGAVVVGVELDESVVALARQLLAPQVLPASATVAVLDDPRAAARALLKRDQNGQVLLIAANILQRKALAPAVSALLAAIREVEPAGRLRLVANLPYQIASPLLISVLEWRPPAGAEAAECEGGRGFEDVAVMVQWEVAQRIVAPPGSEAYGALSVLCQAHAACRITRRIPPSVFFPRPKVDSAFLIGTAHDPAAPRPFGLSPQGYERFKQVVHAAFQYRRKRLAKALELGTGEPPARLRAALAVAELDGDQRGETLSPSQFAVLARALEMDAGPGRADGERPW